MHPQQKFKDTQASKLEDAPVHPLLHQQSSVRPSSHYIFITSCVMCLSGPGVSVWKPRYNTIIWRAENRTHLSKQTRPSTKRSRRASNVRGIPSRPDDQLRWVLIVRTQVYDMGGELPYSQTSRLNHTIDYLITLT